MLRFKGGHKVGKGTYWNIADGNRIDVTDEGILPGDNSASYTRFPPGIVLLAGPVIGLLYVIAMPFMALGMIATFAGRKLFGSIANLFGSLLSFGWRPREAHLTGK